MENKSGRTILAAHIAVLGFLAGTQTHAADAQEQRGQAAKEDALLQRLAKSDARAAALQARIDALEKQLQSLQAAVTTGAGSAPRMQAAVAPAAPQPAPKLAQAAPPPAPATSAPASGAKTSSRSGAGSFEVDEEAAQRALERTLTQSGALLLPARTIELTPSLSYQRTEQNGQVFATALSPATGTAIPVLANQQIRRSEYLASLGLRAGLPYNAQLEIGLPYQWVRSTQVAPGSDTSSSGRGVGDITVGLAKTITRESGWRPDLIGRLTFTNGNGKRSDGSVPLSGGFRALQAEVVALKRQDPLAFVASAFYSHSWEEDGLRPGDGTGFTLAALLAASPATSLQFGLAQIHKDKQEQNGIKVPGSEQTYGIATIGASSVLSRDVTLVTRLGIGLGSDAPKYNFSVAVPILFR